jgi:FkbM family methyltransferase
VQDAQSSQGRGAPDPSALAEWGKERPRGLAALAIGLSRNTPFGRGGSRRMLSRWLRELHPGPVDTHLWGVPVRLHPHNNVSERKALLRPDLMDPLEHQLVTRIAAAGPVVFLDIGANAGLYSLHAALSARPGSFIVAVEPRPDLLARLAFNLALARRAGAVAEDVTLRLVPVAMSDRDGEATLSDGGGEGGRRLVAAGPGMRVPVKPLAGLVGELGLDRIDVLKIDVEGHEDRVLPPFLQASPEALWPTTIVIEHLARSRWAVDCIDECIRRRYTVAARSRNNTVLQAASQAYAGKP